MLTPNRAESELFFARAEDAGNPRDGRTRSSAADGRVPEHDHA
jgi:hypothetical protein